MASLTDQGVVDALKSQAVNEVDWPIESRNWSGVADAMLTYHETLRDLMAVELAATPGDDQQAVYDAQVSKVSEYEKMVEASGGSGYSSSMIWTR